MAKKKNLSEMQMKLTQLNEKAKEIIKELDYQRVNNNSLERLAFRENTNVCAMMASNTSGSGRYKNFHTKLGGGAHRNLSSRDNH
ncbi:hypothetical protein TNCV_1574461 [Trichonephila clavipes]|nr:hypothetical protein TNCV_1574461 [Trichonephila clavipes]